MNELVIFNKIKWLISYSDKYVFNSFTKVHINLKIRYQDRLYSLLENCIRSNTNTGNIRIKYQKEMLIDISLIDYYIGEIIFSYRTFFLFINITPTISHFSNFI